MKSQTLEKTNNFLSREKSFWDWNIIVIIYFRVKYIEEELQKRTNKNNDTPDSEDGDKSNYCSPEEAALQAVPDHLRQNSSIGSEEMLSNQMLSGIPEVDLGIEYDYISGVFNFPKTIQAQCNFVSGLKFETLKLPKKRN